MMNVMTCENTSEPGPVKDMYCFWKDFMEKYVSKKNPTLISPMCGTCDGLEDRCRFYMPLGEREEYISRN